MSVLWASYSRLGDNHRLIISVRWSHFLLIATLNLCRVLQFLRLGHASFFVLKKLFAYLEENVYRIVRYWALPATSEKITKYSTLFKSQSEFGRKHSVWARSSAQWLSFGYTKQRFSISSRQIGNIMECRYVCTIIFIPAENDALFLHPNIFGFHLHNFYKSSVSGMWRSSTFRRS
jgi:hypothetical protein